MIKLNVYRKKWNTNIPENNNIKYDTVLENDITNTHILEYNHKSFVFCRFFIKLIEHSNIYQNEILNRNIYMNRHSGDEVDRLTRRTSNLRIASRIGSNPVRDKPLFPWARNFTIIVQYWLVPGTYSRVFL